MSRWNRPLWLAMVCALWPGLGFGQILFSEDFNDGAAGGRWFVRQEGDNGVPDISVSLGLDYSSLGIGAAPRGTGTIGAKLDANVTGAGGAQGVNIFPTGQSFTGDFVLRFDVWSRVAGDPSNAAEDFLAGVNTTGTRTNWLSIGSTGTDGVFYGVTGNGYNSGGFDYVRYIGNTTGDPQVTPLFNNTDPLPQSVFPGSSGTPQNQWVTVDVEQINGVLGFRLNGVTFETFTNATPFVSGNIFLGHQDVVSTTAGNPDTFSIFDNVTVRRVSRWLPDADGSWNVFGNWSFFTLDNPGVIAYFGEVITAPRTVSLPSKQTMGDFILDSPIPYTFTGPGAITLSAAAGAANLEVRQGSHTIDAPVEFATKTRVYVAQAGSALTISSHPIVQSNVTLTKSGAGVLGLSRARFSTLSVQAGTLRILSTAQPNDPGSTSIVQNLWIAGPADAPLARLDLGNNSMIIDYTTTAPSSTLRQWLRIGLLGGNGLISSDLSASKRLGYFDNVGNTFTEFAGQPVDSSSLLVGYTFAGDANLDGIVDLRDLFLLANSWLGSGFWMNGDFNYDGLVNKSDLTLLAQNWQAGALPAMGFPGLPFPGGTLPEPAAIALGLAGWIITRTRSSRGRA